MATGWFGNNMLSTMKTIPEQLTDIYYKHEDWHAFKMPYDKALSYHDRRIKNGDIQAYIENGEVLGYCERHFLSNVCFFDNIWIKDTARHGKVFRGMYEQFFDTMPKHITHVIGHRGDRVIKAKIGKWRLSHGRNKN